MKYMQRDTVSVQNNSIRLARLWTLGLLLLVFSISLAGCQVAAADLTAKEGQEISLEPGQKVVLEDKSVAVHFVEVVSDSRCPVGVQCIWAGEVSSLVEVTYLGETKNMVLTQSGSSEAVATLVDYQIEFAVEPYPQANESIDARDYRLKLVISRAPAD